MAKLTSEERKKIPSQDFALPGGRYPIEDASHARNALSRVSANGTPSEQARVRAAVHSKYPDIGHAKGSANIMPMGRGMPMRKPPQAPPPPNPIVQAMMAGKGKPQMGQPPMGMPPGAPMVKPGAKPPMMPMGGKGMPMPPAKGGGKPPGFASGTPNVPAAGQMITTGSWTGPMQGNTPSPTPPPTPLNVGALRQIGAQAKPQKAYAGGTSDVPSPVTSVPAPGQTITSGSWTGPQTPPPPQPMGGGQNTNLRSKMKAMGYAGGTPDVPVNYSDGGMAEIAQQYGRLRQGMDNSYGMPGQHNLMPGNVPPTMPALFNQTIQGAQQANEPAAFFHPNVMARNRSAVMEPNADVGNIMYNQDMSGAGRSPPGYGPRHVPNGHPGYATGTPDVPGAAQGYDAQSGSYPQLDDHFVAHLRAAMGMAPKGSVPAYAGGSPNVGNIPLPPGPNDFTMSGPSQQQDPALMVPSPMDPGHGAAGFGRTVPNPMAVAGPSPDIISQPLPVAPGAVGRAAGTPRPSQPAPAPQAPAQGGIAPPVNNQPPWLQALTQKPSGAERISGMLFGGGDDIKMRDATANFYSNPQVQQHLMDDPKSAALVQRDPHGAIPVLASYLDAVNSPSAGQITHMMPNGTVLQKTPDDPNKISVVSAGMGVDPHHAHLMMEPHQYSDDEWINAAASMPMGTARKLWDMQHYLKPQETAMPAYLGIQQQKSAAAQAALDAATKSGNKNAITKAQQVLDATRGETENFLRTLSLGGAWPAGMIGQQQPQ